MKKNNIIHWFVICTFVTLYLCVSIISTFHVIDFFKLSNPSWLAISLAIAFEIGAAASLASLIILDKMNKGLVWFLFILLTLVQMMGNTYFAYVHLQDYHYWVELFGLSDEDPIFQKRVLSIISGAILPLVALGFIKSLVDYIKPEAASIDPIISDDFQIGPNGAYEHEEDEADHEPEKVIPPIEETLDIENNDKPLESPGINTIEEYLGLVRPKKKMNPHIRPGVN